MVGKIIRETTYVITKQRKRLAWLARSGCIGGVLIKNWIFSADSAGTEKDRVSGKNSMHRVPLRNSIG